MTRKRPEKTPDLLNLVRQLTIEGRYLETHHARQRQLERDIILSDVLHVLKTGRHEKKKDQFDEVYQAWNYAIRGFTTNEVDLRVIVSFDEEVKLLIITVIKVEER